MTTEFIVLVAVITGLVQVAKKTGLNSRFAPILSVVLGIGLTYLFVGHDTTTLLNGIIASLTASGLYSGGKTLVNAI